MALIFVGISFLLALATEFLGSDFRTEDDFSHYWRSVALSHGKFSMQEKVIPPATTPTFGATISNSAICLANTQSRGVRTQLHYGDASQCIPGSPDFGDSAFKGFVNVGVYSPLVHSPQALGITLGRLNADSETNYSYFLGKWLNWLSFTLLFALSILVFPRGFLIFTLVGLLPGAIVRSLSFSADPITLGFSALFLALVAREISLQRRITRPQCTQLILAALFLGLTKPLYGILGFAAFLIPQSQFEPHLTKTKRAILAFLPLTINLLWAFTQRTVASQIGASITQDEGISPSDQAKWILAHPGAYFGDAVKELLRNGTAWFRSPVEFVGLTYPTWAIFVLGAALLTTLFLQINQPKNYPSIGVLAVAGIFTFAVTVISTLTIDPVSQPFTTPIYARYFLPTLLLPVIVLAGRKQTSHPTSIISRYLPLTITTAIILITSISVLTRINTFH